MAFYTFLYIAEILNNINFNLIFKRIEGEKPTPSVFLPHGITTNDKLQF